MKIEIPLDRSLCFLDIEATGLHVIRDRILQIAIVKYHKKPDRDPSEINYLINPGIPIPPESSAIHGIHPEDVRNKPTFAQIADELITFIGNSDLAGYNPNRLDIPILMEEFDRAGIHFEIANRRIIDVQKIFYRMEPRTLKAAYKFYCGETDLAAHDAMADVKATVAVLNGQLKKYKGAMLEDNGIVLEDPVRPDIKALHQFTKEPNMLDVTKKLKLDANGNIVFNFGKYNGQNVQEVIAKDRNYYNWILNKEFSVQVKRIVKELMADYKKKNVR